MNYKKLSIGLAAVLLTLIISFLYISIKADEDDNVPAALDSYDLNKSDTFNLKTLLSTDSTADLEKFFPYDKYLSFGNYRNISTIKKDVEILESYSKGNPVLAQRILSQALTDSLKSRISGDFNEYKADSMIVFFQWVEGFKYFAQYDLEREPLYSSIYSYWISFISNKLDEYAKKKSDIKYKFKYRYIAAKCRENKANVSPEITETEKIVNNIVANKWSYLYKRIWSGSILQKIGLFVFIIFTFFAYVITLNYLYRKIKK